MLVHMVPRMTARKDLEWRREGTSKGTLYASTRIIQDFILIFDTTNFFTTSNKQQYSININLLVIFTGALRTSIFKFRGFSPLRPKQAIPHPITIQNMRFER